MKKESNSQLSHDDHSSSSLKYPVVLLADDISSALNVGSLFRLADALGIEHIYLCGDTPVPPDNKIRRTSRSTEEHVAFTHLRSAKELVQQLRDTGYTIISLELSIASTDLRQLSLKNDTKVCLVLGSESSGISQELLDGSDSTVHIPMLGNNSSMNVVTACAIACYEITGQLQANLASEE